MVNAVVEYMLIKNPAVKQLLKSKSCVILSVITGMLSQSCLECSLNEAWKIHPNTANILRRNHHNYDYNSNIKITPVLFVTYRNWTHTSYLPASHSVPGPAKQGNFHFAKESQKHCIPNQKGLNDKWLILGIPCVQSATLDVR